MGDTDPSLEGGFGGILSKSPQDKLGGKKDRLSHKDPRYLVIIASLYEIDVQVVVHSVSKC